jgi:hypothetical protein
MLPFGVRQVKIKCSKKATKEQICRIKVEEVYGGNHTIDARS